jgi:hypothetical protein
MPNNRAVVPLMVWVALASGRGLNASQAVAAGKPGGENLCFHLRLFGGAAPTDDKNVEVVIDGFGFAS